MNHLNSIFVYILYNFAFNSKLNHKEAEHIKYTPSVPLLAVFKIINILKFS